MRAFLRRVAHRIAPTAYAKLEAIEVVDGRVRAADDDVVQLRETVRDLQAQLSEMRQDNRRVAELYDLVFERIRQDNPLRSE